MYVPHKQTEIIKLDADNIDIEAIQSMAALIKEGKVVAFPTETVYGLGADVFNAKAVRDIFKAKGRPADNPLIAHVSDLDMAKELSGNIPDKAVMAAKHFWPGPLTIVVPRTAKIPDEVTAGLDTIGIRMPSNKIALGLIEQAGVPIAAPSANVSGKPSPTTAQHVIHDLAGKIDAIIDGGPTDVGLESTVVDFTGKVPVILRPGGVNIEELEKVMGKVNYDPAIIGEVEKPRAPGMKYTHYSPDAQVIVVRGELPRVIEKIKELAAAYSKEGKKTGIMATEETIQEYLQSPKMSLGSRGDMNKIAASLFDTLRRFDETGVEIIIAEGFDRSGIGDALMNRLEKAAGFNIINV